MPIGKIVKRDFDRGDCRPLISISFVSQIPRSSAFLLALDNLVSPTSVSTDRSSCACDHGDRDAARARGGGRFRLGDANPRWLCYLCGGSFRTPDQENVKSGLPKRDQLFYEPIDRLNSLNQMLLSGRAAADRVFDILDADGFERHHLPVDHADPANLRRRAVERWRARLRR